MVKSLNSLITFLLEEIAICGEHGELGIHLSGMIVETNLLWLWFSATSLRDVGDRNYFRFKVSAIEATLSF